MPTEREDPPPPRGMWRFAHRFAVPEGIRPVSLGEGGTPLSRSRLLPDVDLHWKEEFRNPTGSHKDRALSLAVSHARHVGARVVAVVSAGSTGLSAAAYAAKAGLPSVTITGSGVPAPRLQPLAAFGTRLISVDAGIDALIEELGRLGGRDGIYVASTTVRSNPVQAQACKSIAYELVEELGRAPDWLIVPTGGGGTLASVWNGFRDLVADGAIARGPRLVAAVPRRLDALRVAHESGIRQWDGIASLPYSDDVETVLGKLAHAHPPDALYALAALDASDGRVLAFDDDACLDAVATIGATDGLYLEPSSAIAWPTLRVLAGSGAFRPGDIVVALACGSGFRETFTLESRRAAQVQTCSLAGLGAALARQA